MRLVTTFLAAALLAGQSLPANCQELLKKRIATGDVVDVDLEAKTFELKAGDETLSITVTRSTKGLDLIEKGRRLVVLYGDDLDTGKAVAVKVSDAPGQTGAKQAKSSDGKGSPSTEEPTDSTAAPAGKAKLRRERATGYGIDPDRARQNAFSKAIEQAVGTIVDSKTIVDEKDNIEETIRNFSRGKVDSYKVVKEWEEEGIHHATIDAVVSLEDLATALTSKNIPVTKIQGELMARNAEQTAKTNKVVGEIVGDSFPSYKLTDFMTAKVIDRSKIEGADSGVATMTVVVKTTTDFSKWTPLATSIGKLLKSFRPAKPISAPQFTLEFQRGEVSFSPYFNAHPWIGSSQISKISDDLDRKAKARGPEHAYFVMLAKGVRDTGPNSRQMLWEGHEVTTDGMEAILARIGKPRDLYLKVVLKDPDGEVIVEQDERLLTWGGPDRELPEAMSSLVSFPGKNVSWRYIGPYVFHAGVINDPLGHRQEVPVSIATDDLKRVTDVSVSIYERE